MAFDEGLAARLEDLVRERFAEVSGLQETRMFGGFGYLLHGNMCVGIHKDTLILRVGTDAAEGLLKEKHLRPMDLTGRVMKGWVTADPGALAEDEDVARLVEQAIAFVQTLPAKS
ncbi:MAG: RNA methyltransferase [Candidatus Hydrogenedens sp.]|nr:RNA methyltransferase [Candidatus Hydrogenedens sp.]